MRRSRPVILAGLVLASLACFVPARAAARPHTLPAGNQTYFRLRSSNGFVLESATEERQLILLARKGGSETRYTVPASRIGRFGVRARLPGVGVVQARFVPEAKPRTLHNVLLECKGSKARVIAGTLRGQIRLRGERGYTQVDRTSIKATVYAWAKQRCQATKRSSHRGRESNRLGLFEAWVEGGSYREFDATRYRASARPPGQRIEFEAGVTDHDRGMTIERSVTVSADLSTIQIPQPTTYPEHLIISPPAPFRGTGTLSRNEESLAVWSGDLSVEFPGTDPIPLVGPDFNLYYCAIRGCLEQFVD